MTQYESKYQKSIDQNLMNIFDEHLKKSHKYRLSQKMHESEQTALNKHLMNQNLQMQILQKQEKF